MQLPDNDISLAISFLNIEFLIRKGEYSHALQMVERLAQSMHQESFDVYTQIKLLCLKARIIEKTGQPQRGFSLAMRAASLSYRSRFLPGLWEAISVLARVLLSLNEFEGAAEMMESIMPQVLESEDRELIARSYSVLVDANMGMAGRFSRGSGNGSKQDNPVKKKEYMTRALEYINCSYDEYEKIEDLKGQCEMLAKKATVMHCSGDLVLANDCAAKYLDLKRGFRGS
jgi:anaphase-promoting complex subunit 5